MSSFLEIFFRIYKQRTNLSKCEVIFKISQRLEALLVVIFAGVYWRDLFSLYFLMINQLLCFLEITCVKDLKKWLGSRDSKFLQIWLVTMVCSTFMWFFIEDTFKLIKWVIIEGIGDGHLFKETIPLQLKSQITAFLVIWSLAVIRIVNLSAFKAMVSNQQKNK